MIIPPVNNYYQNSNNITPESIPYPYNLHGFDFNNEEVKQGMKKNPYLDEINDETLYNKFINGGGSPDIKNRNKNNNNNTKNPLNEIGNNPYNLNIKPELQNENMNDKMKTISLNTNVNDSKAPTILQSNESKKVDNDDKITNSIQKVGNTIDFKENLFPNMDTTNPIERDPYLANNTNVHEWNPKNMNPILPNTQVASKTKITGKENINNNEIKGDLNKYQEGK